ncbi:MAG: M4 family metallopeptidase [Phycisphaerae bacterium]|nr:M4 family metallopeptidase [Saprospiraceae bacterium]
MKNLMLPITLFFALGFLFALQANAQVNPKFRNAEDQIDAQGNLMHAFFPTQANAPTLEEALTELKMRNKIEGRNELRLVSQETDELGSTHYRYQQFFAGIPVDLAEFLIHVRNGKVFMMNGEAVGAPEQTPTQAFIQKSKALDLAAHHMGAKKYTWQVAESDAMHTEMPVTKLVIVRQPGSREAASTFHLAYRVDIMSVEPLDKKAIYVNGLNGAVLKDRKLIADGCADTHDHAAHREHEASCKMEDGTAGILAFGHGMTRYSGDRSFETSGTGTSYFLYDDVRKINTANMNSQWDVSNSSPFFDENDNNWTWAEHGAIGDDVALDAHWGASRSHDYFKDIHNRNGYNGLGAITLVYAHCGSHYNVAEAGGGKLWFGDGDGIRYRPLVSLDVVGHEFAHNVCETTAGLVYQNESGALNEAFSDIWGACIEAYAAPEKNHWRIADEIKLDNYALRDLSNPNALGQPDTYQGTFWYSGTGDAGGVHTNSGVLNHWFYLLSDGGSGTNDLGFNFGVAGIGIHKAGKIAYYMERYLLGSTSTYANINSAAQYAAIVLYGNGSAEHRSVQDALYAVGLNFSFYCMTRGLNSSFEYIASVEMNGVNVTSGNNGGYANHTNRSFTVTKGNYYQLTMTPGYSVAVYPEAWKVWIDFNQDGGFSDSEVVATNVTPNAATNQILIPANALSGSTRMRVAMSFSAAATTACTTFAYGEVEDFTVNVLPKPCTPTSNNTAYEYIGGVTFNTVFNVTGQSPNGYGDYTYLITQCKQNAIYNLGAVPGFTSGAYPEYWKAWIDYNNDGDFNDAGETIMNTYGSFASVTATFTIPADALPGPKRLRIAMSYDPILTTCVNNIYGEVEDYILVIISSMGINETEPTEPEDLTDPSLQTIVDEHTAKTGRSTLSSAQPGASKIDFSVMPNPSTGILSIRADLANASELKLEVFAANGQLVLARTITATETVNETINLTEQADGFYMLRLSSGDACSVKTIVLKK